MNRTHLLQPVLYLCVLALATGHVKAQTPLPPTGVQAVPRYDATISLVVSWQDNSGNEDNFEIHRREVGGTFGFVGTTGPNVTQFVDTTATPDKSWEYRVRARSAANGNSAWNGPSLRTSPRQVWPMPDGDHDILHTFGQPLNFGGNRYFHEGVDISASNVAVNASRGGVVTAITNGAGGTVRMTVDMGAAGTVTESYLHITANPPLFIGQVLAPNDFVGTVRNDYFNRDVEADHVHWGDASTHKLQPFTNNPDRDPNMRSPVVADINNDGKDFIVVAANNNDDTNPREPAWGDVDFLVDAYDDMAANLNLQTAPFRLGYWIDAGVPGGNDVQSAATPYQLVQFDFQLHGAQPAHANENAAVYWPLNADIQGINTWQTTLTWILTNTSGTTGANANLQAGEFWRTDARTGTGTKANRSDASRARENQEAQFPDGKYYVNIVLADLVNTSTSVREVLVDNSRPYVASVRVFSGASLVYISEWQWDSTAAQLTINPSTFDVASGVPAARTRNVTIEIEFSEPMATAALTSVTPALGPTPTLSSTQATDVRTVWRGTISHLDIADDGSDDGVHMIGVTGTDLAGNQLLQLADRTAIGTNNHNRDNGGNLRGAQGNDTVHGFEVGALEGELAVKVLYVRSGSTDPTTPTIAQKSVELADWLNTYFEEVAYGNISFTTAGHGWYPLSQALSWYYALPQTPLVDLVQEAIQLAEADGVDLSSTQFVLVVTDESTTRDEWSTHGGWPYDTDDGLRALASGVLNLASPEPRISNLACRMVGLLDLFAYPYVITSRPFVGSWSHMSDKDTQMHVLGWEKWRAGWVDETGTATGKLVRRVAKPAVASPIAGQTYTLDPLDGSGDGDKVVAIEIGQDLYYTVEYRRQVGLDSALPDAGVVITKTNDLVKQGEGPAIVQESGVTAGDLSDAPFTLDAARSEFDDIGSGVHIEVLSISANEAQIRLDYAVPPFENDIYVAAHNNWQTVDIWIDAPDLAGNFEADPHDVVSAGERPVIGVNNKLIGRVRNNGAADATNFEVELEILEPWGSGGTWHSLKVDLVTLLQGQVTNPGADYLIVADWTPTAGEHTCVKLRARGVANDLNSENNFTQENIHEFTTTAGSPYQPVISRFQVHNPYSERLPFLFRVDGVPDGWKYILNPARPVLDPDQTILAQIILQPADGAPVCTREEIMVNVYVPQVDTLVPVGGITLAVSLKGSVRVSHESWTDCGCDCPDDHGEKCSIYTRGCTDPGVPNQCVAIVYTSPSGEILVHYVNTDDEGCFSDIVPVGDTPGIWQTQAVIEETDCTAGDDSRHVPVDVPPIDDDRCPDLIVEVIGRPVWDGTNKVSVIQARIKNIGNDASPSSLARLIDPSTNQPSGAPYNDVVAVPTLTPGATVTVIFRLPYWVYNPDATLEVTADYKGTVRECNEKNNTKTFKDKG